MIENTKKLSCGGCGYSAFKIYTNVTDTSFMEVIYIQCMQCSSITVLRPEQPRIMLDHNRSEGEGTLCYMGPETKEMKMGH